VELDKSEAILNGKYGLSIEAGNLIEIQETHCLEKKMEIKKLDYLLEIEKT